MNCENRWLYPFFVLHKLPVSNWCFGAALIGLAFSSSLAAAGPLGYGRMSTVGTVWTNSVALPSGTTVHRGDRIATGRNAVAVISSPATGRVEVRPNSDVTLADRYVALHEGVVASEKVAVTLADYKVKPKDSQGNPWFAVASRQGQVLIAAYRGDVLIARAGLAPVLVPAGSYAVPAPGPEPRKSEKARGKEKRPEGSGGNRGAVAAGGWPPKTNDGWTIGSLSHGASVALIAGIGAGAAVGVVAAFALGDPSPSPSQ